MQDRTRTPALKRAGSLIARCLSGDTREAVQGIEQEGLWEYVVSEACRSEVGGALIRALRSQGLDVPGSAAMQLDAYREHLVAANAYNVSRTAPVLARLQTENVPFLLLKGAALNTVLYDDPGARAMVDLDVLIRPCDADRADGVLTACGCSRGPDLLQENFYPRYHYEREYFTPHRPPVKIDLHGRPFRPLRYARTVPDDALWDKPQRVMYGDLPVAIPGAQDMLIHLAVHAACHGLGELKWLYDLKLWTDRFGEQIDTGALASKCRRWNVALPVQRALERVSEVFGRPTSALMPVISSVSQPAGFLDRLALSQAPRDADHPAAALLVNVVCTPGLRFRLGYLKAVLFPGRGHLAQLYHRRHPGWTLVAHVVRILRCVARPLRPAAPEPA